MLRWDARRMRRVRPTRRAPRILWGRAGRMWNFVRPLTGGIGPRKTPDWVVLDGDRAVIVEVKQSAPAFTTPPTDVTGSKIAMLNDTCGNLNQITQLMHR